MKLVQIALGITGSKYLIELIEELRRGGRNRLRKRRGY